RTRRAGARVWDRRGGAAPGGQGGGDAVRGGTSTSSSSNLSPSSGLGQYHGAGAGGDIRPGAGLLVPQRPPDPQPATQPADQRDAYPVDRLTAGDGGAVGLLHA